MKRKVCLGGVLFVCALCVCSPFAQAQTETFGFYCITNTVPANAATGEAQLSVDVTDGHGLDYVTFNFWNNGPNPCAITDVYFANGSLLALTGLIDADDPEGGPYGSEYVDFTQEATPGNLPGADETFNPDLGFTADSDPPVVTWGVGNDPAGQWLGVLFSLTSGDTDMWDVVDELNSGELRIGIHVQGFDGGGSESFINVPEPASMLLLGLGGLALLRKRRV